MATELYYFYLEIKYYAQKQKARGYNSRRENDSVAKKQYA